jgi:hypothetical protein
MGCARFIWNAKCDEYRYHSSYARKYCPIGTFAPVDQQYSHFKSDEISPWLSDCPSQILRNSASNWFDTFQDFKQGHAVESPKERKKQDTAASTSPANFSASKSPKMASEGSLLDQRKIILDTSLSNFINLLKIRRLFILRNVMTHSGFTFAMTMVWTRVSSYPRSIT